MYKIGEFKKVNNEYVGNITINNVLLNAKLIPNINKHLQKHPDFKIYGSRDEKCDIPLGVGWNMRDINLLTGENINFISCNISNIGLENKIYFNVFDVDADNAEAKSRERLS